MSKKSKNGKKPAPMRVLIINQYIITPDFGGGTRHYSLAKSMRERGHDIDLVASSFIHTIHSFRKGPEPLEWLHWLGTTPYQKNVSVRRALASIIFGVHAFFWGLFRNKYDIIIGSSPDIFVAFFSCCLAKVKGSKFIYEVRDLWPESLEEMGVRNPLVTSPMRFAANRMYKSADGIICLTKGIIERLKDKARNVKIEHLPNGVDLSNFESVENRDLMRRKLGWEDKFVCLYAGNHSDTYGLKIIPGAAELLKNNDKILFCLIGDGPEKPLLKEMVKAAGITNVQFLDPVPKREIASILCAADACIESQAAGDLFTGATPNKLFDYLASNNPILCANQGEGWRVVDLAQAGVFVEPENARQMADAALALSSDSELKNQLSGNGRSFIELNYSLDKITSRFEHILLNALWEGKQ